MRKVFKLFILVMSIILFNNKVYAYQEYKVGDIVIYNNEAYYTIEDSDSDTYYITLLKANPLTADEVNKYNNKVYNSENGEMLFADTCNEEREMGGPDYCIAYNYDDSYIKLVINSWSSNFEKDLVSVNGYKARLITLDDLVNNLGYKNDDKFSYYDVETLKKTNETPNWVNRYSYWTMNGYAINSAYFIVQSTESKMFIRPVINLKKNALNSCKKNYKVEKEILYTNISAETFFTDKYGHTLIFLEDSDENTNYVVLMSGAPLSNDEINKYSNGLYNDSYVPYYISDTCNSKNNMSGCKNDYDSSIVKQISDNWAKDLFGESSLIEVNGYKTRLLTIDELVDKFGYIHDSWSGVPEGYTYTEYTNSFLYSYYDNTGTNEMSFLNGPDQYYYNIWTMSPVNDSNYQIYILDNRFDKYGHILSSVAYPDSVWQKARIKPLAMVDKCSIGLCHEEEKIIIENECISEENNQSALTCKEGINYKTEEIIHYNKFKVGNEVEYNGEKYHVIEDSSTKQNYITLLKDKPLTKDELYEYGKDENGDLFVNKYSIYDDYEEVIPSYIDESGKMVFYSDKTCGYGEKYWIISNYGRNFITTGCTNDYNNSDVKKVIDNWSNDIFGDNLIEVNGYKARIIALEDLTDNLKYEFREIDTAGTQVLLKTENTPNWINNSNYSYWTMTQPEDSNILLYVIDQEGKIFYVNFDFELYQSAVRPVVNVDKCAIYGGCEIEEVTIEDGCIEDTLVENTTVNKNKDIMAIIVAVGNTLKSPSNIVLIICVILTISGIYFLISSYIKSKKELKNNLKK